MIDGRIVKNFSLKEMSNNLAKEDIKLVLTPEVTRQALMMQELRDWYGKPMEVNSWYRTLGFNNSVGGDPNSCHLDGIAIDIGLNIIDSERKQFIAVWKSICIRYGVIGGISIYEWGLHFDSNNTPTRYGKTNSEFRITDFRRK